MSLNLKKVNESDNLFQLSETVNSNFEQIQLHGGGPMGPRGRTGGPGLPGRTGSRGDIGPQGLRGSRIYFGSLLSTHAFPTDIQIGDVFIERNTRKYYEYSIEETLDWFLRGDFVSSDEGISGMINFVPETFDDDTDVTSPPVVAVAKTDSTLLLSNIYENTEGIATVATIDDPQSIAQKIPVGAESPELLNYRLKVYNGDVDNLTTAEGGHMHLGNSVAMTAKKEDGWFSRSGFTMSVDWDYANTETLRFTGLATSEAHKHKIDFSGVQVNIGDLLIDKTGGMRLGGNASGVKFSVNDGIKIGYTEVQEPGIIRWTGTKYQGSTLTGWVDFGGSGNNGVITVVDDNNNTNTTGPIYVQGKRVAIGSDDTFCAKFTVWGSINIGEHFNDSGVECGGTMQYKAGRYLGRNDNGEWVPLDFFAEWSDDGGGFVGKDPSGNKVQLGTFKLSYDNVDLSIAKYKGIRIKSSDGTVKINFDDDVEPGIGSFDLSSRGVMSINHSFADLVPRSFPDPLPESFTAIEFLSPDCSFTITPRVDTTRVNEITGESIGPVAQYEFKFNPDKQLINLISTDQSIKITKREPDPCDDCNKGIEFDLSYNFTDEGVCNVLRYENLPTVPESYTAYEGVTSGNIISLKFDSAKLEGSDVTTASSFKLTPTADSAGDYHVDVFMLVDPVWDITGGDTLRPLTITLYAMKNGVVYSLLDHKKYVVDSTSTVFPISIQGSDIITLEEEDVFEIGLKVQIANLSEVHVSSAYVSGHLISCNDGSGGTGIYYSHSKLFSTSQTLKGTLDAEIQGDYLNFIEGDGITLTKLQLDDDSWAIKISVGGVDDGPDKDWSHLWLKSLTGTVITNTIAATKNDDVLVLREGPGILLSKNDDNEVVISASGSSDNDYDKITINSNQVIKTTSAGQADGTIKLRSGTGIVLDIINGEIVISANPDIIAGDGNGGNGGGDDDAIACNILRHELSTTKKYNDVPVYQQKKLEYDKTVIAGDGVTGTAPFKFTTPATASGKYHVNAHVKAHIRQLESVQNPMLPTSVGFALYLLKNNSVYCLLNQTSQIVSDDADFDENGEWDSAASDLQGSDIVDLVNGDVLELALVVLSDINSVNQLILSDSHLSMNVLGCGGGGGVSGGGGNDIDISKVVLRSKSGGKIEATKNDDTLYLQEGRGIKLEIEGGAIKISTDTLFGSGGSSCNAIRKTDDTLTESLPFRRYTVIQDVPKAIIIEDVSISGIGVVTPTSGAFKFTPDSDTEGLYQINLSVRVNAYFDPEESLDSYPEDITYKLVILKNNSIYSVVAERYLVNSSRTSLLNIEHVVRLTGSDLIKISNTDVISIGVVMVDSDGLFTEIDVADPTISMFNISCGSGSGTSSGGGSVDGNCSVGIYRTTGCTANDIVSYGGGTRNQGSGLPYTGPCGTDVGALFPFREMQPEHAVVDSIVTGTAVGDGINFSFTPGEGKRGFYHFDILADFQVWGVGGMPARMSIISEVFNSSGQRIKTKELDFIISNPDDNNYYGNHSLTTFHVVELEEDHTIKFYGYVQGPTVTLYQFRQTNCSFHKINCGNEVIPPPPTSVEETCPTRNLIEYHDDGETVLGTYYENVLNNTMLELNFPDEIKPGVGNVSSTSPFEWTPAAGSEGEYDITVRVHISFDDSVILPMTGTYKLYLLYRDLQEEIAVESHTFTAQRSAIVLLGNTRAEIIDSDQVKVGVKFIGPLASYDIQVLSATITMEQVSGCDTDLDFTHLVVLDKNFNIKGRRDAEKDAATIYFQEGNNMEIELNNATGVAIFHALLPDFEADKCNVGRYASTGGPITHANISGQTTQTVDFKNFSIVNDNGTDVADGIATATPFTWKPNVDQDGWYDIDAYCHLGVFRNAYGKQGIVVDGINVGSSTVTLIGNHTTGNGKLKACESGEIIITFRDTTTGIELKSAAVTTATYDSGNNKTTITFGSNKNLAFITNTNHTASWYIPFNLKATLQLYVNGVPHGERSFVQLYEQAGDQIRLGDYCLNIDDVAYLTPSDIITFKAIITMQILYDGEVVDGGLTQTVVYHSGCSFHKTNCGALATGGQGASGSNSEIDFSHVGVKTKLADVDGKYVSRFKASVDASVNDDTFNLVEGSNVRFDVIGKDIIFNSLGPTSICNTIKYSGDKNPSSALNYYNLPNATLTEINLPTIVFNGSTVTSTTPFKFIPKSTRLGQYQVNAFAELTFTQNLTRGWEYYELHLMKNGVSYQLLDRRSLDYSQDCGCPTQETHMPLQGSDIIELQQGDVLSLGVKYASDLNQVIPFYIFPDAYISLHYLGCSDGEAVDPAASGSTSAASNSFNGGRWSDSIILEFESNIPVALECKNDTISNDDAISKDPFIYKPAIAGVYEFTVNIDGVTEDAGDRRVLLYKNDVVYETMHREHSANESSSDARYIYCNASSIVRVNGDTDTLSLYMLSDITNTTFSGTIIISVAYKGS